LDVVSLNYFEAIEMLESHKNIWQISSQFEILDNFIQPYPEFQGIPTLVHPRVVDNNLLSEVGLLHWTIHRKEKISHSNQYVLRKKQTRVNLTLCSRDICYPRVGIPIFSLKMVCMTIPFLGKKKNQIQVTGSWENGILG